MSVYTKSTTKPPVGNRKRIVLCDRDYLIYDDGRLWACTYNCFLKTRYDKDGYVITSLGFYDDNGVYKKKIFKIHRLVLTYFGRKPTKNEQCRHLDGNKQNNHISNLKWGTSKQNSNDKKKHGTQCFGETVSGSKLTDTTVKDIVRLYLKYRFSMKLKEFCIKVRKHLDLDHNALSDILRGRSWKHITKGVDFTLPVRKRRITFESCMFYEYKRSGLSNNAFSLKFSKNGITYHTVYNAIRKYEKIGILPCRFIDLSPPKSADISIPTKNSLK
jgi:hypothetical protein